MTGTKLSTRYEVHVKPEGKDSWTRSWGGPMDFDACRKWIKNYNKPLTLGGFVHIPAEKKKYQFRIVKLERTVVEETTKEYK